MSYVMERNNTKILKVNLLKKFFFSTENINCIFNLCTTNATQLDVFKVTNYIFNTCQPVIEKYIETEIIQLLKWMNAAALKKLNTEFQVKGGKVSISRLNGQLSTNILDLDDCDSSENESWESTLSEHYENITSIIEPIIVPQIIVTPPTDKGSDSGSDKGSDKGKISEKQVKKKRFQALE